MGAGKILCILGGVLALVGTLFFSFYSFEVMPGVTWIGYGIGLFMNFADIFDLGTTLQIVFAILYAICVVSGIFILIGAKSRAVAIVGAIFALLLGVILFLVVGLEINISNDINGSLLFFIQDPLVEGIIPFDLNLGLGVMSLGTVLLLAGGVLGLIGGIMGTNDY